MRTMTVSTDPVTGDKFFIDPLCGLPITSEMIQTEIEILERRADETGLPDWEEEVYLERIWIDEQLLTQLESDDD